MGNSCGPMAMVYNPDTTQFVQFDLPSEDVHLAKLLFSGANELKNDGFAVSGFKDIMKILGGRGYTGIKLFNCKLLIKEIKGVCAEITDEVFDFITYIEASNCVFENGLSSCLGKRLETLKLIDHPEPLDEAFWKKLRTLPLKHLKLSINKKSTLEIYPYFFYKIFSSVEHLDVSDVIVNQLFRYPKLFEIIINKNAHSSLAFNARMLSRPNITDKMWDLFVQAIHKNELTIGDALDERNKDKTDFNQLNKLFEKLNGKTIKLAIRAIDDPRLVEDVNWKNISKIHFWDSSDNIEKLLFKLVKQNCGVLTEISSGIDGMESAKLSKLRKLIEKSGFDVNTNKISIQD